MLEKDWALFLVRWFHPTWSLEEAMLAVNHRRLRKASKITKVMTEKNVEELRRQGHLDDDDLQAFETTICREKIAQKFLDTAALIKEKGLAAKVDGHARFCHPRCLCHFSCRGGSC